MYLPKQFEESRDAVLHDLIRAYPLGALVTHRADGGFTANHVPFEVADAASLYGHVARQNELAQMDGAEVLVVFQGPDGYISPNWYPTKHETGREVPTWDYAVVHVHGRLRVIDDAVWLRGLLETLTQRHEANQPQPWRISDAPDDHIESSLKAIVGIVISIERIEGKFKLGQNHLARNQAGVLKGLRERNVGVDLALADFITQLDSRR